MIAGHNLKQQTMKTFAPWKTNLFAALLLLCLASPAWQALAADSELSKANLINQCFVAAMNAAAKGQNDEAVAQFKKLIGIQVAGGELPSEWQFYYGRSLLLSGENNEGETQIKHYIQATGTNAPHYWDALNLLNNPSELPKPEPVPNPLTSWSVADFVGTYKKDGVQIDLKSREANQVAGYLHIGQGNYAITGNVVSGVVTGYFSGGQSTWPFSLYPSNGQVQFISGSGKRSTSIAFSGPSNPLNEFSWIAVGSTYSQYAGLLAGFMFTAIIIILSEPRKPRLNCRRDTSSTWHMSSLLLTCFGGLLTAFLLAHFTGYPSNPTGPEPIHMQVMAALISFMLALTVAQMFLSLYYVLHYYRLKEPVLALARLLFYVMVVISLLLVLPAMLEAQPLEKGNYDFHTDIINIVIILVALALMVLGLWLRKSFGRCFRISYKRVFYIVLIEFILVIALYFIISMPFPEDLGDMPMLLEIGRWLLITVLVSTNIICASYIPNPRKQIAQIQN